MRVVLDTNTVVSGFLWDNQPRAIIDAAIDGRIEIFTCAGLIEELAAQAELIVSRDRHLRNLKHFHRIPILNATDALHRIEQQTGYGISG